MAYESPTSLHFRELAAMLLTATFLHVCYTARRKSLAGAWSFLTQEHASLADVRAWIVAHHERPDGLGYPLGLSGEQIPIEARIVAVAFPRLRRSWVLASALRAATGNGSSPRR